MTKKFAENIIREFDLTPHPEGGYYREIYRDLPGDGPAQRMCLEFARNFMSIQDKSQQEALSQMARVLAEDTQLRST